MPKTDPLYRQRPPALHAQVELQLCEPQMTTLSNGIRLYAFNDPSQQAFRLDVVLQAGSAHQSQALAATTALKMLREGTTQLTAGQLNKRIDYHGAYLDLQTTKDYGFVSLYCLHKSLTALLPLLVQLLSEPRFAERNFRVFNQRQLHDFRLSSEKTKHLANRLFSAHVYGPESRYGQVATEADFKLLNTRHLHEFHHQYIQPSKASVVISGHTDAATIELINRHLGQWKDSGALTSDFEQHSTFEARQIFQRKEHALQSTIMMGRQLMERTHPDYHGFLVLNTLLGGYFGSRLMSNIREDKGYTYGIQSSVSPMRKATGFVISTEVGKDVTADALHEIRHELRRLADETVSEQELQLVKNYLNGIYLRSLDGVFSQADKFRLTIERGEGMRYFAESLKAMHQTRPEQLRELAQKYLQPEDMLTVVVGDAELQTGN